MGEGHLENIEFNKDNSYQKIKIIDLNIFDFSLTNLDLYKFYLIKVLENSNISSFFNPYKNINILGRAPPLLS